jgi:hypothetical protein
MRVGVGSEKSDNGDGVVKRFAYLCEQFGHDRGLQSLMPQHDAMAAAAMLR